MHWLNLWCLRYQLLFKFCLEGRPWFHPLGGVPSTVHQMVKIPHDEKVVTIKPDDSELVATLATTE